MATQTKSKSLFGLLKAGSSNALKAKEKDKKSHSSTANSAEEATPPTSRTPSPMTPTARRTPEEVASAATSILWLKLDEEASAKSDLAKQPTVLGRRTEAEETASAASDILTDEQSQKDGTSKLDAVIYSSLEDIATLTSGDEKSDVLSSDSTTSTLEEREEAKTAFRSNNTSFSGSLKNIAKTPKRGSVKMSSAIHLTSLGAMPRSKSCQHFDDDRTVEATEFTEFTEFTEDDDDSPRDSGHSTIEELGDDPGGLLSLSKFLGNSADVAAGEEEEILDDSEDNILYIVGFGTLLVKGGTLSKLVEKLCDHLYKDENYETDFIRTLTYFTTPTELLNELKIKFDTKPDVDPLWRAKALLSNRTKIYALIKKWITLRYDDFLDEQFKQAVIEFAETKMKPIDFDVQAIKTLLVEQANKFVEKRTKLISEKEKISTSGPTTLEEILDTNPRSLAEQLTAYELEMFKEIEQQEYMRQAWNKKDNTINAPKILQFIRHFNKISMWTSASIVSQRQFKKRVERTENIMKLLAELIAIRNFNGAHQIMAGLNVSAAKRLKDTWGNLSKSGHKIYTMAEKMLSSAMNYKIEREAASSAVTSGSACIPFLGMYLTDLTFTEDGNPSIISPQGYINFGKYRKLAQVFTTIQRYQQVEYPPKIKVQAAIRRYIEDMVPPTEQSLFQLSYMILPRGCKKTEKEIEKETNERDTELTVFISLEDEGSEKKEFKFNIHQTVKYCKDKICSRITSGAKLSPAEYSLYIPNKGDFKKNGGFRLDEGRAIGSYRLKDEDKLILCKRIDGQMNKLIVDNSMLLVTITSQEHSAKKMFKVPNTTTIGQLKAQFMHKVAPNDLETQASYVLCHRIAMLHEGSTLASHSFQKLVDLSFKSLADYHKELGDTAKLTRHTSLVTNTAIEDFRKKNSKAFSSSISLSLPSSPTPLTPSPETKKLRKVTLFKKGSKQ